VGHRISVTGTLAPMSVTGAAATATAGGATATARSTNPRLQVSSIQMIATDCPAR
jgi:hypothetical protein